MVVLVDDQGNEEKLEFHHRLAFELWAATNTLTLSSKGGRRECIKTWERLQDGGRYYTSRTLEKTVGIMAFAATCCTSMACPLWRRAENCNATSGITLLPHLRL